MEDNVIDTLRIEVTSDSSKAVSGIDKLISTLERIKSVTSGSNKGLGSIKRNLESISKAADKINSDSISKIDKLAESMKSLSAVSKIKISSKIADRILDIGAAIDCLKDIDFSKLTEMANGLQALGGVGNVRIPNIDNTQGASSSNSSEPASTPLEMNVNPVLSSFKKIQDSATETADKIGKVTEAASTPINVDDFIQGKSELDILQMKLEATKNKLGDLLKNGEKSDISGIANLLSAIKQLEEKIKKADKSTHSFKECLKKLGDTGKAKFKSIGDSISKPFTMITKRAAYRAINAAISAVTGTFKDGVNAVYQYSKTMDGQLAKSLDSIATSVNYLKNSLGAMVAPLINMVAPAIEVLVDKFVDLLNIMNQVFARLSGASTWTKATKVATEYAEAADSATAANKKLKKSLLGIDEINALQDNSSSGSGSSGNGIDFSTAFEEVPLDISYVDGVIDKLKDILWYVGEIGLGFLAWKLSSSFLGQLGGLAAGIGVTLLVDSIRCVLSDGISLKAIIEASIGGALLGAGIGFKLGGWQGAIGGAIIGIGISLLIVGITSMISEGVNTENVISTISGALFTAAGIMTVIKLFNTKVKNPVPEIDTASTNLETISTGTSTITSKLSSLAKNLGWGLLILVEVAAAALIFAGTVILLGKALEQVGIAWQPVINMGGTVAIALGASAVILGVVGTATALLGKAGGKLAGDIAIGTLILLELAVPTALFVAEVWAIGKALEQVGIAWQPVINMGDTIATAIGIGTGILVGIGVVTALLGVATVASAGLLPLAIGLGTAILLELGAATLLFIAEVWAIGKALDELGQAWQPVIAQEDTISVAIEKGTELLIGIGVVTAALGVASVATVGLLPLAIALGTALLVDLAESFVEFCDSLIDVVLKLTDLEPPLSDLNAILPGLKTDMDSFTSFMKNFANAVVQFTKASAIAGIAATIDKVIGFFTTDPIKRMYDEVTEQTEEFEDLIPALEKINPLIAKATKLVGVYKANMGSFESATGGSGGFLNSIVSGAKGVINGLIGLFEGMANGVIKAINFLIRGLNKISFDVPDWVPGIGGKKLGFNIATISEINIPRLAEGGVPATGQMFIAREAGAELVGNVGRKTGVMNNDQIVESVSQGVADANAEQNALLREEISILRKILEKDSSTTAYVGTGSLISGLERKNRRDGRTIVPIGV